MSESFASRSAFHTMFCKVHEHRYCLSLSDTTHAHSRPADVMQSFIELRPLLEESIGDKQRKATFAFINSCLGSLQCNVCKKTRCQVHFLWP